MPDPLRNPKDPLRKIDTNEQELFRALAQVCTGASGTAVITAAANLIINALRQAYPDRRAANSRMDELTAKIKGILDSHYDPVSNKRRNIFPYTQVISPDLFNADDQ